MKLKEEGFSPPPDRAANKTLFCRSFSSCGRSAVAVILIGLAGSAMGQVYPVETHGKEIDHASKVISLPEFGAFGDGTDYSSGTTTFRKTIVEIPGNGSLRVAADYIVKLVEHFGGGNPYYVLERDLPYIEGTHSSDYGWVAGKAPTDYTKNRCSDPRASYLNGGAALILLGKPVDVMASTDYWDGNSLYTPDAGGGIVRPISTTEPRPVGVDIKWATNSGWRFSCNTLPDGSEGFVGHRPNGDKYYFGIPAAMAQNITILSPDFPDSDGGLEVDKFRMYINRIEDRFGNWVNYAPDQITSSDGRVITFASNPALGSAGTVVRANGKQWTISGDKYLGPAQGQTGSFSVTNPDNTAWDFSLTGGILRTGSSWANSCWPEGNIPLGYSGQITVVVNTESGATGTFVFQPRRFGFSYVDFECASLDSAGKYTFSKYMHFIDGVALVSRAVSGPGISTYSHTINYGSVNACYAASINNPPNACTSNSPTTRTTIITGADGSVRTLTFGNRFNVTAGLLLAKTEGGLKSTSFEYVSLYQNFGGFGKRVPGYDVSAHRVYGISKEATTLQGRSFIKEVPSTCGTAGNSPCFDNYFRPTKIVRSSAPNL